VSNAGFNIFIPVPPKTSFPKTTAKNVAMATIHKGMSIGTIIGISIPETKNPSLTSWCFICEKANSVPSPTT